MTVYRCRLHHHTLAVIFVFNHCFIPPPLSLSPPPRAKALIQTCKHNFTHTQTHRHTHTHTHKHTHTQCLVKVRATNTTRPPSVLLLVVPELLLLLRILGFYTFDTTVTTGTAASVAVVTATAAGLRVLEAYMLLPLLLPVLLYLI